MQFEWNPNLYDNNHSFVSTFGEEVVTLLNPQEEETILDLGCGTGDLTRKIADSCNEVVGLDNSYYMIQKAKTKYPEITFLQSDAKNFQLDNNFDAIFSNAVLHWIPEADTVIKNINTHLKSGGRFVAEFGGKGCVDKIISSLTKTLDEHKIHYPGIKDVLYYPSIGQYSTLLERNGFELNYAVLFDRPTELEGGLDGLTNFIEMFFDWLFMNTGDVNKTKIIKTVNRILKQEMFNGKSWIADYRRIRILAKKIDDPNRPRA